MKTKHPVRWVVAGVAVIYFVIFSLTHKEKVYPPLDYNRPVYTTDHAIVCPMSLLSDSRADHDYHAVLNMYMSTFTADSQAAKLGCEVLTGGIRVVATRGPDVLVTVNKVYFTVAAHLTNNEDGTMRSADSSPSPSTPPSATQDETFDTSKASINTSPTSPIPSSNGSGTMLVSSPSKVPMLKGDVNAANLRGFGAVICPDSKAFAAYLDTFDAPNKKTTSDLENMRRFGCSYFPPGTAMVSEGGDPNGSLVAVKVNLSDNRTVVGVTFSNWIVQNEQQREKAIQQPLTEKQTTQSEPQTAPTVYQVENPAPPAQTPSIPEIDRQAITLWNQKRYADAIPLFNQACSGGKTDSCYRLGLMYDFGQGVTQDSSRAAAFYSKSCNAGIGAACYHLSMLQQYQPGGAVCNSVAVTRNLSRSCDTGIATSCSIVGYSYIHGCGVAKDTEKGRQLLSKGCSLGDHNACDGIK